MTALLYNGNNTPLSSSDMYLWHLIDVKVKGPGQIRADKQIKPRGYYETTAI